MFLRILIMMEGDWFVAQCLELDLGATAKNLDDVLYQMEKTLVSRVFLDQSLQRRPFEGIPKAPEKYFEMWQRADAHHAQLPRFKTPEWVPRHDAQVRIAALG